MLVLRKGAKKEACLFGAGFGGSFPKGSRCPTCSQSPSGWKSELEGDGSGAVTVITRSGGEIGVDESEEFSFEAQTPQNTGEFAFGAFQTYEDGEVVEWTGPPDSEELTSVVRVIRDGSQTGIPNAETEEHGDYH